MSTSGRNGMVVEGDIATVVAENNNGRAHKKGISHQEMVGVYSEWAKTYEQDLCPGRYNGPQIVADAMSNYYQQYDRHNLRILDIAAGTGRVGLELARRGFTQIDALEPSEGMLAVLAEKHIYDRKYQRSIGFQPIVEIRADTYDALVIAGGMGEGHIPIRAFDEMLRILKPGGMIYIIMREEYLTTVDEYKKLEPFLEELVYKQLVVKVERRVVPKYSFNNKGVVYIYQKL